MNIQLLVVDPIQPLATDTSIYVSTNCRSRIDKVTVSNPTGSNRTMTFNIVPFGGTVGADNEVIPPLTVLAGQCVDVVGLEGHSIGNLGSLTAKCDSASTCVVKVSGIQVPI